MRQLLETFCPDQNTFHLLIILHVFCGSRSSGFILYNIYVTFETEVKKFFFFLNLVSNAYLVSHLHTALLNIGKEDPIPASGIFISPVTIG